MCWYAEAQPAGSIGWRRVGTSAMEVGLPGLATGPVDRVWYSDDGSLLYARTASGRIFQTKDFEQWRLTDDLKITPPAEQYASEYPAPEPFFKLANQPATSSRLYGIGQNAYRSDDGGQSWANLTAFKGHSILGGGLSAMAVSPRDSDEVVVASNWGVWRSVDGGLSWSGLNDFLPNLPLRRFLGLPSGTHGVRMSLATNGYEIEWAPGEKTAWKPTDGAEAQRQQNIQAALSQVLARTITAVATAKDYIYAGDSEGRLRVSSDAGNSWGAPFRLGDFGRVEAIWVDANDPRVAVAALGARTNAPASPVKPAYVLRTMNGGGFWDDITANLPDTAAAHGVAADRASGAVYVATDAGVFYTTTDLGAAGRPTAWTSLSQGLPAASATDVKLDAGGNQLYVAMEGYGVYTAIAPHRLRDPRVVSAADYSARPAAPGALLSVLGAHVESARSGDTTVPVLDASETASQIQVPFEAKGSTVTLSLDAPGAGALTFGLALQNVSPAIFVDPEGTPLVLDASSGVLLDASKPAHAGARLQILATGLGRVTPDWPTGLAAPLNDPPQVAATVHAYLDGAPVDVTQATLAPGYVGFYLISIQLPRITNTGPAELYLEAEGQQSNRVRLYIQP
ncbi:MAG TPA: hypothetical protein VMU80_21835 [Bryobacteraceae bacterium]|nr:hypothetical protein [Bryobacteraceae bacterium]